MSKDLVVIKTKPHSCYQHFGWFIDTESEISFVGNSVVGVIIYYYRFFIAFCLRCFFTDSTVIIVWYWWWSYPMHFNSTNIFPFQLNSNCLIQWWKRIVKIFYRFVFRQKRWDWIQLDFFMSKFLCSSFHFLLFSAFISFFFFLFVHGIFPLRYYNVSHTLPLEMIANHTCIWKCQTDNLWTFGENICSLNKNSRNTCLCLDSLRNISIQLRDFKFNIKRCNPTATDWALIRWQTKQVITRSPKIAQLKLLSYTACYARQMSTW